MKKTIFSLVLGLLLVGCSHIRTTTVTYQGQDAPQRGTLVVLPGDPANNESLAFNSIRKRVAYYLSTKGFEVVDTGSAANFVAFVNYKIDKGRTVSSSTPIFGQTGGGTSYSSGMVSGYGGSATYSGTTYKAPTYGVVGVANSQATVYTRDVWIDIFKWDGNKLGAKTYEIKAISEGSCGNVNAVVPVIIDAMFKDFPGEDGKTQKVTLPWDGNC